MTDNEIIKALEKCASIGESCEGCPFYEYTDCDTRLKEEFHNLINRQNAEIERLGKDRYIFKDGVLELIPRTDIEEIKSEAIKEFAERLKEKATSTFYEEHKYVDTEDIDNLVKEMAGDNNG